MHTVDLVNLSFSRLAHLGIDFRFVTGDGLSSGLCRLGERHILFMNDSTTASEQMQIIANVFDELRIDLRTLPTPLREAVEVRLSDAPKHAFAASSDSI
jgi:hypothetical protein